MEYVSLVAELNYMTQFVIMLYEDPNKELSSEERFTVELHFSPGVNCCVNKDYLPPGPGFRKRIIENNKKVGEEEPGASLTKIFSTSCSAEQVQNMFGKEGVNMATQRSDQPGNGCGDDVQ